MAKYVYNVSLLGVCGRPYSSSDRSSEIKVMVAVEVVTRALNMNDSLLSCVHFFHID